VTEIGYFNFSLCIILLISRYRREQQLVMNLQLLLLCRQHHGLLRFVVHWLPSGHRGDKLRGSLLGYYGLALELEVVRAGRRHELLGAGGVGYAVLLRQLVIQDRQGKHPGLLRVID
jgi:hypothetical protein